MAKKGLIARLAENCIHASHALFPENTLGAPSAQAVDLSSRLLGHLDELPPHPARLVRLMFAAVELLPILLSPSHRRFSRLSPAARLEFAERLRSSRFFFLHLVGESFKGVLCMIYLSTPEALAYAGLSREAARSRLGPQIVFRTDAETPSAARRRPHAAKLTLQSENHR